MRVCYFGTYRTEYARNQISIEGLRQAGIEVTECHVKLWKGVEDRVRIATGGWLHPTFWLRVLSVYLKLFKRYRQVGRYDILIVGYPGHFDVFLARLLSWLRQKPLVWDVLNSMYLITLERGILQRRPFVAKLIWWLEKAACQLPDLLILDTQDFVHWFHHNFGTNTARFRLVPIGADERFFHPIQSPPKTNSKFVVIYYGSYIPNHGVQVVVSAAHLLQSDTAIHFEMIGTGPDLPKAREFAEHLSLQNITFTDWLERDQLAQRIAAADLVLGAFGNTQQMRLTNNNKIFEGFAMRKPVISSKSPALPTNLQHLIHLYLCEPSSPHSLAEGIQILKANRVICQNLADQGYRIFQEHFDVSHIGCKFAAHLRELVGIY